MAQFTLKLKPVFFLVAALYVAVSSLGMAAMVRMPMYGAPTCAMLGHQGQMCPMSVADHFASRQGAFRTIVHTQVPSVFLAVAIGSNVVDATFTEGTGLRPCVRWHGPLGRPALFMSMVRKGACQRLVYE